MIISYTIINNFHVINMQIITNTPCLVSFNNTRYPWTNEDMALFVIQIVCSMCMYVCVACVMYDTVKRSDSYSCMVMTGVCMCMCVCVCVSFACVHVCVCVFERGKRW